MGFERCGANRGFSNESKPALLVDSERFGTNGDTVSSALVAVTGFVVGICLLVDASGPDRGTSEGVVLEGESALVMVTGCVVGVCLLASRMVEPDCGDGGGAISALVVIITGRIMGVLLPVSPVGVNGPSCSAGVGAVSDALAAGKGLVFPSCKS